MPTAESCPRGWEPVDSHIWVCSSVPAEREQCGAAALDGLQLPSGTEPSPSQEQPLLSRTLWGWPCMTPPVGGPRGGRAAGLLSWCTWWDARCGEGWWCRCHAGGCQAWSPLLAPGAGTAPREWAQILPKTQTKEEACVGTERFLHREGLHQGQECFCLKLKWSFQSKLKLVVKATMNICDLLTKAFLVLLEITLCPLSA